MADLEHNNAEAIAALDYPVLFADRITNISFGPLVSKLVLANEISKEVHKAHTVLAIPTPALIDAINFILETLSTNESLKGNLLQQLDEIKVFIEHDGKVKISKTKSKT